MRNRRITVFGIMVCLCFLLLGTKMDLRAASAFSDFTFDASTGIITVHSDVPDVPLWQLKDADGNEITQDQIKEVVFDEGVTSIGKSALDERAFNKVTKVVFSSSVKTIADRAFTTGSNLEPREYVFSEGLEVIGEYAFSSNYKNCDTLELPQSLKSIGAGAFMNMSISHLALPVGLEYIGPGAFANVRRFDDCLGYNYSCLGGALYNKEVTRLVQLPKYPGSEYEAPATLKVIGEKAINKPYGLETIILPEGFEDVEDNAVTFTGAIYEEIYYILPSTLRHIGTGNFNIKHYPICFRGTREQWAAIDDEDRDKDYEGLTNAKIEDHVYFEYEVEGIHLSEITLYVGQERRVFPSVTPGEAVTVEQKEAREKFKELAHWFSWNKNDEDYDIINTDTTLVGGGVIVKALKPGDACLNVQEFGRSTTTIVHVVSKSNSEDSTQGGKPDTTQAGIESPTTGKIDTSSVGSASGNVKVNGSTYRITNKKKAMVSFTKARNVKNVVVPNTVKISGKKYYVTQINANAFKGTKAKTVTIGASVTTLKPKAFSGSKVTKLTVKSKKLKKATVKGSLKGSKVKTIKVKVGKKNLNLKYKNKYKKIFTKKNCGKKVSVK